MTTIPSEGELALQIDQAVSEALSALGQSTRWRTYNGPQQASLVNHLQSLNECEHVGLASSGSAALEIILRGCNLQSEDEVLLAGYDYPGNFAAIERVGARPALVDIEPQGWNLDWESLNATVTSQCRVLIATHLHGQLQAIDHLQKWCEERGIYLIQDACQALGATFDSRPLATFADATLLSFGGSKVISAGRGGAWLSNNPELAQRIRRAEGVGSGVAELSEFQAAAVNAQLPFLGRVTELTRRYFSSQAADLEKHCPQLLAPWKSHGHQTAFYQAGWVMKCSEDDKPCSNLLELRQSQHAAHERVGIGSGFPGYHRRSRRRCRVIGPLRNTERIVATTLTVHHRAALNNLPVAEAICELLTQCYQ